MAKFKLAGKKKKTGRSTLANVFPCLFLMVMGATVITLLFWLILRSA